MNAITIQSGTNVTIQINTSPPTISPLITDVVIKNVAERGYTGTQGRQGIPGTGVSQINTPMIPINNSCIIDALDPNIYCSCLWIVTAIDPLSNLYRTGVINATRNSWSHYAIVGDLVLYKLTVDNLVLSVTNNHANPITLSVIRLPNQL